MFAFAIGLVLPAPTDGGDAVSQRLEALHDLDFELRQRLAVAQPELNLLIWWHNPCGSDPPPALQKRLQALIDDHPVLEARDVESLPGGLQRWLLNSQVVVQITLPQAAADQHSTLLLERRLTHGLGSRSTLVQELHPHADQTAQWLHFRGETTLQMEQESPHHPLLELQNTLADFSTRNPAKRGLQLASSEGLQSRRAEAWARSKAWQLQARSDGRLWLQACALALLLAGVRHWLPRLAPALLLLIIGVWLLARQPKRQQAQHWWSAADGLWVQGLWHRFGVDEAPADWLDAGQPTERSPDHDALVGVVVAHQLWQWLQPPRQPWRGAQLVDALEGLRERLGLVEASLQQHLLMRQLMLVVLAVMGVGMVAILLLPWIWLEQLELMLAVAVAALHLGTPLPLVDASRLSQHQLRLERARQELLAAQIQDLSSDNPVLRESVGLWIRRVGAEVLDLCADGLRSAGARRRWLP